MFGFNKSGGASDDDDGSSDLFSPLATPLQGSGEEYAGQSYDRAANHLTDPNELLLYEQDGINQGHNRSNRKGSANPKCMRYFPRRTSTLLLIAAVIAFIVSLPTLIVLAVRDYKSGRTDFAAFYSAASFVLATLVLSTREIYKHLRHWYMPDVQKYVVRILWMVPVYAMQSWLSLRFHKARIYIDTMRDLYEAFVIQSFVYYLIELLGGEERLTFALQNRDAHLGEHGSFLSYFLNTWEMGAEFLAQCKWGVLQYVVIRTLTTILTALLIPLGLYGEGSFDLTKGYAYISFTLNSSVMYALYCLVKLFHATSEDLTKPVNWHPIGKFLCVKGVVFFTWWQGVFIFFLRAHDLIGEMGIWSADDVAYALQDYLICIEMLFFALAHSFTFTYREYLPPGQQEDTGGNDERRELGQRRGYNGLLQEESLHPSAAINGLSNHPNGDMDDGDAEYRPPVIRTLYTPMGFRDALWSSTIPEEAYRDIRRLRNGVSDTVRDEATDPGMISMSCLQNAESI